MGTEKPENLWAGFAFGVGQAIPVALLTGIGALITLTMNVQVQLAELRKDQQQLMATIERAQEVSTIERDLRDVSVESNPGKSLTMGDRIKLEDFFRFYRDLPHQKTAVRLLSEAMPDSLLKMRLGVRSTEQQASSQRRRRSLTRCACGTSRSWTAGQPHRAECALAVPAQ